MVENQKNNNNKNWFDDIKPHIVEIQLIDDSCFSKIVEVLTRIGIPSYKTHTIYQTAHILHKRRKYYIVHFKDMFVLDGKQSTINQIDIARVYTIANLLQQWGLCTIVNPYQTAEYCVPVLVVPREELHNWKQVPKYTFGKNRN